MTINSRELIEAASIVAENHNLRVTVKSSLKAGAVVGASTFVGAVLLGPIGILLGSVAGGITSYSLAKDTFKPAAVVLREDLTEDQKNQFCDHIIEAFREFGIQDLAMLVPLLTTNLSFQKTLLTHIMQFLTNELRMQIID